MMIAREGLWFILSGLALTTFCWGLAIRFSSLSFLSLAMVFGILTLFTTYFFRDPERRIVASAGVLLSPADGKVVRIVELAHHPHIGGPARQVSIFLSALDVHINRIPASGVIDYVRYIPGKYLLAWKDKASEANERTEIGMTTAGGEKIVFKQIAGTVARRIVCRLSEGDQVSAGDRFGLIRFGSRTDILLPLDARVEVKVGDKVTGGLSHIGSLVHLVPTEPIEPKPSEHEESNAD